MKTTTNYGFNKPEGIDVVNIEDFNSNADAIDVELAKRAMKTDIPVKISQLNNDLGFITSVGAPVLSINGKVGNITLASGDIGAEPAITKNTAFNQNFETNASNLKMDGTALVGTSSNVSRADHVHPSGTTKVNQSDFNTHLADIAQHGTMARQAIINGNFDIWQRGTSITNPLAGTLVADRYKIAYAVGGTPPVTITHSRQQITPGDILNSSNYYRINISDAGVVVADNIYYVAQGIENGAKLLAGLNKKITISFYARSSITNKKIGIFLTQSYGTGGVPSASETILGQHVTLTSSWTRYTFTFVLNTLVGKTFGTNNDDIIAVKILSMWGSTYLTYAGDTVAETFVGAGNIDIAQIQANAGDMAVPFSPKNLAQELQDCQRYYEKSGNYADAVGTGILVNLSAWQIANSKVSTEMFYKVRKRTTPTVTLYDNGEMAGKAYWTQHGSSSVSLASTANLNSEFGFSVGSVATDSTAINNVTYAFTADAEL